MFFERSHQVPFNTLFLDNVFGKVQVIRATAFFGIRQGKSDGEAVIGFLFEAALVPIQ